MSDFKDRADRFGKAAAGKAKTFALFAANKTRNVSRIAKLNVDIASERDSVKRSYSEIGKLYYETHRDDPESYFLRLCQDVDRSMAAIARMEAEIVRLKTGGEDSGENDTPAE